MASRFQFPELKDLPSSSERPSAPDEPAFTPLYLPQGQSGDAGGSEPDGWAPLYHRQQADTSWHPGGVAAPRPAQAIPSVTSVPAAPGTAPEPARAPEPQLEPPRPTPPPAAAPEPPRVDPREIERIKAQARQEGYQEGFSKGETEGRAAWQGRIAKLEQLLLSMGEAREALFHRVREDLVRIMCAVPRKILRQELKIDRRAIVSLVGSVLEELPRQDRVVVKVSPEDLAMLEEAIPELRRRLGGYTNVEVEPSAQVSGGGAIVVIDGGRIEATIDRQLETFEQRAREWLMGGEGAALEPAEVPTTYGSFRPGER